MLLFILFSSSISQSHASLPILPYVTGLDVRDDTIGLQLVTNQFVIISRQDVLDRHATYSRLPHESLASWLTAEGVISLREDTHGLSAEKWLVTDQGFRLFSEIPLNDSNVLFNRGFPLPIMNNELIALPILDNTQIAIYDINNEAWHIMPMPSTVDAHHPMAVIPLSDEDLGIIEIMDKQLRILLTSSSNENDYITDLKDDIDAIQIADSHFNSQVPLNLAMYPKLVDGILYIPLLVNDSDIYNYYKHDIILLSFDLDTKTFKSRPWSLNTYAIGFSVTDQRFCFITAGGMYYEFNPTGKLEENACAYGAQPVLVDGPLTP
jgi:hypothetical protein